MKKILVYFFVVFGCFSCNKDNNDENLITILKLCNKRLFEINSLQVSFTLNNLSSNYEKTHNYGSKLLINKLAKNFELYSSVVKSLDYMTEKGQVSQEDIKKYYIQRDSYLDNIYSCVIFYFGGKSHYFLDDKSYILLDCIKHPSFDQATKSEKKLIEYEKQKMVCNLIFMEYFGTLASVISLEERQS